MWYNTDPKRLALGLLLDGSGTRPRNLPRGFRSAARRGHQLSDAALSFCICGVRQWAGLRLPWQRVGQSWPEPGPLTASPQLSLDLASASCSPPFWDRLPHTLLCSPCSSGHTKFTSPCGVFALAGPLPRMTLPLYSYRRNPSFRSQPGCAQPLLPQPSLPSPPKASFLRCTYCSRK